MVEGLTPASWDELDRVLPNYRKFRVLRLFPGWTERDYEQASARFVDEAIQFDLIERTAAAKQRRR